MHPIALSLTAAGLAALVSGCTSTPAPPLTPGQLTGSTWHVAALNAGGVQTRQLTIKFVDGGRVVGNAACNDYSVGYTLEGRRLRFGKSVVLTTDRFCDQDTRETEDRFIATLGQVRSASLAPSGSLVLYTETSNRIVARPL